jgi:hypothetical protein
MSKLFGILEQYRQESWKIEHDSVMACYDFDDWLGFGLKCLESIREKERRFKELLKAGTAGIERHGIEEIQALYEQWYSPCRHLLDELENFERKGCQLTHAQAFRAACLSSNIPGFEPQRLQSAAERARAGAVKSAKEVRHELQRRISG